MSINIITIRALKNWHGDLEVFEAGKTYPMRESIANHAIKVGLAERVEGEELVEDQGDEMAMDQGSLF